ncbi:MAG: hypothetical protein KC493_13875 [Bacteriovoracaceae bacterium]|nr:hypothetical protein [Bacteriovoracaceae bacterium]
MAKLLAVFITILLSTTVYSKAKCPPGTTPLSVNIYSIGRKIDFCQIKVNGKLLKHGPEKTYNNEGTLVNTKYYVLGRKTTREALVKYVNNKGIPKSKRGNSSSIPPDAINAVKTLFKAMMPFLKDGNARGNFIVRGCRDYRKEWASVLLTGQKQTFNYSFKKGCDIQGTISAMPGRKIKMNLKLRNVGIFERVDMGISYSIKLNMITRVDFKITDGTLFAKGEGDTSFTGDYAVELNPMKKSLIERNLGGNLYFSKIFGKDVKISKKIMVNN